jgi:hypothetical protein
MKKILEPSINRISLGKIRINTRKIWKILGKIWTAPKRIFETFCAQEALRCIGMNATHIHLFNFRKTNKGFPYTIFPVKK